MKSKYTAIIIPSLLLVISMVYFTSTKESSEPSTETFSSAKISYFGKNKIKSVIPAENSKVSASVGLKEYEEALNSLIDEIPTLTRASEPRVDSENVIHGFQSDEFIEGHMLAKIRKLALENEKFISSTQIAYAGCAERKDFSQSVRAICFMRALEISIKLNNPQVIVDLNVPAAVRQLALQLVN